MSSAAVKITDAEIKRQAVGDVRDLRDIENRGLYLRFTKARERASWYPTNAPEHSRKRYRAGATRC
jgi:hypothetical protein